MKRLLVLLVLGFVITGCETTRTIGYHEHYNNCMMISGATMEDIARCGKEQRLSHLKESNLKGSAVGDNHMFWVDLLAEQVRDGKLSETEAKMKLLDRQKEIASIQREREIKYQQQNQIDWGKVAEQFTPKPENKNKRKCVKHGNSTIVCEDAN